jgi:hypothetical protein
LAEGGGATWPEHQPTEADKARKAADETRRLAQGLDGLSADPNVRAVQVENRLRAAYQAMGDANRPVAVAHLRKCGRTVRLGSRS